MDTRGPSFVHHSFVHPMNVIDVAVSSMFRYDYRFSAHHFADIQHWKGAGHSALSVVRIGSTGLVSSFISL